MSSIPVSGPISFSTIKAIIGGTSSISLSQYYNNASTHFTAGVLGIPAIGNPISVSEFYGVSKTNDIDFVYQTPGSYVFTVPPYVTELCVLCIGGGGGGMYDYYQGGGGGALAYANNISVIPGTTYNIFVGKGGLGGWAADIVQQTGGPGNAVTDGGLNGQPGQISYFNSIAILYAEGGGSGNNGWDMHATFGGTACTSGGKGGTACTFTSGTPGGAGGGGVGIYGGSTGGGGALTTVNGGGGGAGGYGHDGGNAILGNNTDIAGIGGSGGTNGSLGSSTGDIYGGDGGNYGGGGGAGGDGTPNGKFTHGAGGQGGNGIVRIMCSSGISTRSFPNTAEASPSVTTI
jgi:hypothetical protein